MSVMFANTRGAAASHSGNIIEIKAGRIVVEIGSSPKMRKCYASSTKGLIYIKQTSDQLLHFCWKNRDVGKVELDLIIFPGDTEFIRIKECTDGRVFMLKFKSSNERFLFWMQDESIEKDQDNCDKVNEILNSPPPARPTIRTGERTASATSALSGLAALNNALGNGDDIGALGNMDQNQIMQLFSLMNGSASSDSFLPQLGHNSSKSESQNDTPVKVTRTPSKSNPVTKSNAPVSNSKSVFDQKTLNAILNAIPQNISSPSTSLPFIDFSSLLSRSNVQDVVLANAERLIPHLPDQKPYSDEKTELRDTIGNPQFRQATDFFGQALQTGKLAEALPHFGIKGEAVASAASGEQEQKTDKRSSTATDEQLGDNMSTPVLNEPPRAKRGKTDDNMELD